MSTGLYYFKPGQAFHPDTTPANTFVGENKYRRLNVFSLPAPTKPQSGNVMYGQKFANDRPLVSQQPLPPRKPPPTYFQKIAAIPPSLTIGMDNNSPMGLTF